MRHIRKGVSAGFATGAIFTLAACSSFGGGSASPDVGNGQVGQASLPGAHDVGLIIPLTGRYAPIGMRMRDAAKLALAKQGSPALDVHDSNAAGGAAKAAEDAISRGDAILLGPLTATDTSVVAPLAINAGTPELAFTSDTTLARPGVWVMGLTPEQQVRRMVDAAKAIGKTSFAAFLPDNPLGHAMAEGLQRACSDAGLKEPQIAFHATDGKDIDDGLKTLSAIADRQQTTPSTPAVPDASSSAPSTGPSAIDPTAEISSNIGKDATASIPPAGTPSTSGTNAVSPPKATTKTAPPPFDALVLADTGLQLGKVIKALQADHINSTQVQIMGPALWKAFDGKLGALHGAWYTAPDSQSRNGYVAQYKAVYHQSPSPVTDFAYDSAALAGVVMAQGAPTQSALTRSDGYMGVDGLFRLRADGHVTRGLAVFQIQRGGGAHIIVPASREIGSHPS
ncbi:penicillin-binding protein activator [Swingsia samuiensis]|uniref:Penicillin-binding protein activator n=1 Tax=Swingsia samuiensis TaxID=1293412 RepID=A0A4Y6ULJ0_9PROT|nr:penicillin-binding protein activator [Swingsia samuiensis]QDH17650.1 penicillin-binding protein activator [Swingsia samuiensis]